MVLLLEANGEDVTVKLDDATANKINNAAKWIWAT